MQRVFLIGDPCRNGIGITPSRWHGVGVVGGWPNAGHPLAVIVDGAVELREGAEVLLTRRQETLILGDFKHFAANVLKRDIGGDPRWTLFTAQVGATRSWVQQTELGHLTPPRPRPKARFMNLGPTLKWARMAAWQLAHPHSKSRVRITTQRFIDKLGWLGEFTADITRWNACQEVVNTAVASRQEPRPPEEVGPHNQDLASR